MMHAWLVAGLLHLKDAGKLTGNQGRELCGLASASSCMDGMDRQEVQRPEVDTHRDRQIIAAVHLLARTTASPSATAKLAHTHTPVSTRSNYTSKEQSLLVLTSTSWEAKHFWCWIHKRSQGCPSSPQEEEKAVIPQECQCTLVLATPFLTHPPPQIQCRCKLRQWVDGGQDEQ